MELGKIKEIRGKIEIIEDSLVKCYLGKGNLIKSSKDLWNELKNDKECKLKKDYKIGDDIYVIEYPIIEKDITIITSASTKYKSKIYFIDDIKNIINYFNMANPCFLAQGEYIPFKTSTRYSRFLNNPEFNEIKDVGNDMNFLSEQDYINYKLDDSNKLIDINKNIKFYTGMDGIENQEYFFTNLRSSLNYELDEFYENKRRKGVVDVIYGIFGNYASGKSLFLMHYNYITQYPSIYLNLKALKKSSNTKRFREIFSNELIILYHKLQKAYKDFNDFVSYILEFENETFDNLILNIIKRLQKEQVLIILDQYKEELFSNQNFIKKVKKILFNSESNIKVIISSSMDNGSIAKEYLKILLDERIKREENDKEENKTNDYIPYNFVKKLVDESKIKQYILDNNKQNDKLFNDTLKLFSYLPLYFNLCMKYNENLDNFVKETKKKIKKKVSEFNSKEKNNLIIFDEIRKMINNEISNLDFYSQFIPFKYFYIEKIEKMFILRTHFPLINDIWNEIIMEQTVDLFDGELNYDGDIIGSLLELNLIMNIKDKKIDLDIDCFCKVDTIYDFGKFIETETQEFKNKNIFITQLNQNAQSFDIAYVQGKNTDSIKLCYIQVKKGYSKNRISFDDAKNIYEAKKNNFQSLFKFEPNEVNLVYITLINDKIKEALINHANYKIDRNKKVSDLGRKLNSLVYSVNQLNKFCLDHNIRLYYYWPKKVKEKSSFYIKSDDSFKDADLDLFKKNNTFRYSINIDSMYNLFKKNEDFCNGINFKYKDFLQKKRNNPNSHFNYNIDDLDIEIVFKFAETYFINVNIINYFNRKEFHSEWSYHNLSDTKAIICLKFKNNRYFVDSFIYKNYLFKVSDDTIKRQFNNKLEKAYDFLVTISFDAITKPLRDLI